MLNVNKTLQTTIEHLEFFEKLCEGLEIGAMLVDRENRICWINSVLLNMDLCKQTIHELPITSPIPIDSSKCGTCPFVGLSRDSGSPIHFCTLESREKKDEKRVFLVMSQAIRNEDGEAESFLHFAFDETEREAAYKKAQILQITLTNVLDNTADAVITLDQKGEIFSWNRGAWQVFGHGKSEARGKNIEILIPDDESALESFAEIQRLLGERGFVRNHRVKMHTKDKRVIDVAVTQTVMQNEKGVPIGSSLIIRDISTVVRLEKSLSQKISQREKLLQLDDIIRKAKTLQEIYNNILVAVTAGEGLRFNRAFLFSVNHDVNHLSGIQAIGPEGPEEAHEIYSSQHLGHMTLSDLVLHHFSAKDQLDVALNKKIRKVEISLTDTENPLIRALNERRPYLYLRGGHDDNMLSFLFEYFHSDQFVAVPLVWQDRNIGLILADNHITKREITMEDVQFLSLFANRAASAMSNIQLHEDLQAKVDELKNAYRQLAHLQNVSLRQERLAALGQITSKVAHEIRNPLSSIGGFARILKKTLKSDSETKYLDIISSETERLEEMLEKTLGKVRTSDMEPTPVDINGLLEECLMIAEQRSENQSITFIKEFSESLPPIPANDRQIKQAMLNIIQNGIDAMGLDGTLSVTTIYDDDFATIKISDTGIGMNGDQLEKLFNPFFTTKRRGVGLGLNITKQIIDAHNGRINVVSRVNEGTSFETRLPLRIEEVSHDEFDQEEIADR